MEKPIVIASRQSPLAVAQAKHVRALLAQAAGIAEADREEAFPLKTYVTTGDTNLASSLSEVGGKGLFVKEVEAALLTEVGDIAVHSMKDMPAQMPAGLIQAAVPEREDPRDAFVTLKGEKIDDLPRAAVVGTSSVRRAAQLRRRRPDLEIVPFRGNVATRLEKLKDGVAVGTFLAEAGLRRLGLDHVIRTPIEAEVMLPALGQGALCIQTRDGDTSALNLCRKIASEEAELAISAERAFVAELDGSCRTPMGGLAAAEGDGLRFRAEILSPDGALAEAAEELIPIEASSHAENCAHAAERGQAMARALLDQAPRELKNVIRAE